LSLKHLKANVSGAGPSLTVAHAFEYLSSHTEMRKHLVKISDLMRE
jgi:hypothetical protein